MYIMTYSEALKLGPTAQSCEKLNYGSLTALIRQLAFRICQKGLVETTPIPMRRVRFAV